MKKRLFFICMMTALTAFFTVSCTNPTSSDSSGDSTSGGGGGGGGRGGSTPGPYTPPPPAGLSNTNTGGYTITGIPDGGSYDFNIALNQGQPYADAATAKAAVAANILTITMKDPSTTPPTLTVAFGAASIFQAVSVNFEGGKATITLEPDSSINASKTTTVTIKEGEDVKHTITASFTIAGDDNKFQVAAAAVNLGTIYTTFDPEALQRQAGTVKTLYAAETGSKTVTAAVAPATYFEVSFVSGDYSGSNNQKDLNPGDPAAAFYVRPKASTGSVPVPGVYTAILTLTQNSVVFARITVTMTVKSAITVAIAGKTLAAADNLFNFSQVGAGNLPTETVYDVADSTAKGYKIVAMTIKNVSPAEIQSGSALKVALDGYDKFVIGLAADSLDGSDLDAIELGIGETKTVYIGIKDFDSVADEYVYASQSAGNNEISAALTVSMKDPSSASAADVCKMDLLQKYAPPLIWEVYNGSEVTITSYRGKVSPGEALKIPAEISDDTMGGATGNVTAIGKANLKVAPFAPANIDLSNGFSFTNATNLVTILDNAFAGSPLEGSFEVPTTVTAIGKNAFAGTKITGLTFASTSTVATIGEGAFAVPTLTSTLTIPDSVTAIGKNAFAGTKLTGITFDGTSTVETIGDYAFANMTGDAIATLEIPASVTTIGKGAFQNTKITALTIAEAAALAADGLGADAFNNCGLKTLTWTTTDSITNIVIPAGAFAKNFDVFDGTDPASEITLPHTIKLEGGITAGAFTTCKGLKTLTFTKTDAGDAARNLLPVIGANNFADVPVPVAGDSFMTLYNGINIYNDVNPQKHATFAFDTGAKTWGFDNTQDS